MKPLSLTETKQVSGGRAKERSIYKLLFGWMKDPLGLDYDETCTKANSCRLGVNPKTGRVIRALIRRGQKSQHPNSVI